MDGMCFDYDHYFAEETFIIDDFGEICEDVVRIAGSNGQFLCKDFDAELRRQESSPPPGSYISSGRCFEKEVSSLFSEMEYLTEVSPGTGGVVLSEAHATTIAVNPTEFSCKRTVRPAEPPTVAEAVEQTVEDCATEAPPLVSPEPESNSPVRCIEQTHDRLSAPIEYQRILNNYIQKGRRKLEASSYSKMKASCQGGERWKASTRSTSSLEPSAKTSPGSSAPITAMIVSQPSTPCSASIGQTVEMLKLSQTSYPTVPSGGPTRFKTARLHHCRDCGLSYASSESLRRHSCIIAEQYQCHLCLREFKKRKTLDHHMKSHDKVFSTDDDLRK